MRILIVSDVWPPFISGVVRTYVTTVDCLRRMGHDVRVISPNEFHTLPCPTYPQLRLSYLAGRRMARLIDEFAPEAIHLATEGPLGVAARAWCLRRDFPFTTSYTTKFPEYIEARFHLPARFTYPLFRWFHSASAGVMVASDSLADELDAHGFRNIVKWSRGVDTQLFRPRNKAFLDAPRPISIYVGRVAVEKNIDEYLNLRLDGTKYVVGDGPQLRSLKKRFPSVRFAGAQQGEELASYYAAADVLVFPSRTDTFGLVILESLASGVPVAAHRVTGPLDAIGNAGVGVLDEDLARAATQAMSISPDRCRVHAQKFSWNAVSEQFLGNLCAA